ncbi:restriction endonuclease subunit S, partial [Ruminococcaceae bacterium OttesenSCG-928-A11]|nr:restriction endonuclease subunit S [Ruminococcaceae bacterium OttesenSCG-928-A11]
MKAAELRQSILQMAVQGKLVPQDLHDEPASELLVRIKADKAQLIKEGKIKKEKPLPPISEDEVPYDLPDGWAWCRLGELGEVQSSKRVFTSELVEKGIPFYRGTEVGALATGTERIPKYYITEKHYSDLINHTGKPLVGDLLMPSICPDGRIWLVDTDEPFYFKDGRVLWVRLLGNCVNNRYIQQSLKARLLSDYSNIASGTTFAELKIFLLKEIAIPLPPLAEQQRIVEKVDELVAMCDELEAAEKELDTLENHFIEYLPKSILQMAVQGKLVPQDLHDEPASELLARIKAEKAQLIKEGKIKKEKPLPPIAEDEIPYDLPDGWVWCRLGEVIQLLSGRDLETRQFNDVEQGIPYITGASAIDGNSILINRWTEHPSVISQIGDLLVSCKGTVGKMVFNEIGDCHIARQIMSIRFMHDDLLPDYVELYIQSYVQQLVIQAKSIIPGISREHILLAPLPVPPFTEQQRIVAKVGE